MIIVYFTSFRFGVNPLVVEENGNNVFHLMVRKVSLNRKCEEYLKATYQHLCNVLDEFQIKKLIFHKNIGEFRPVEWAMFLNAYGLAMAILTTPGIYLVKEIHKGGEVTRWFDMTDYEENSDKIGRRDILYGLLYLRKINVQRQNTTDILESAFVRKYVETKMKINFPFCLTWFLLRFHFIMLTYLYTFCGRWALAPGQSVSDTNVNMINSTSNTTSPRCTIWYFGYTVMSDLGMKILSFYVLFWTAFILICDLVTLIMLIIEFANRTQFRVLRLFAESEYVVQYAIYIIQNFIGTSSFLILFTDEVTILLTGNNFVPLNYRHFLIITALAINIYGLFMFQPISESFGWFVTVMQRLSIDLIEFGIFIITPVLSVSLCNVYMSFVFGDIGDKTIVDFAHNYLLMLVGHGDLPRNNVENNTSNFYLYSYLRGIMIFASLLFVNFLIAIFSESVSQISKNRLAISTVQKLYILSKTEIHFRRWPFLEKLYRYQRKKYFKFINGRLLLKVNSDE